MSRFIMLTFAFLGWAFYELSGGADFEPRKVQTAKAPWDIEETKLAAALTSSPTAARPASGFAAPTKTDFGVTLASFSVTEPAAPAAPAVQQPVLSTKATPLIDTTEIEGLVAAALEPVAEAPPADIRQITGNRVNMRNGPGTDYSVLTRLDRGTEVEVLQTPGNGWLKLKVVEGGRVGWMADWLVTTSVE